MTPELPFPGTQDDEEVTYSEWEDKHGVEYQGMLKADGTKHGIVRTIARNTIYEETFNNNQKHGLSFQVWDSDIQFKVDLYQDGELKSIIYWDEDFKTDMTCDWNENTDYLLSIISPNDFKK